MDIKRVSILVGSNIPYAHIQKEVRVPEDKTKGLYGCRCALGWCVSGPYDVKCRQGVSANFVSLGRKPDDLIERFWNLEDYGAVKSGEKPLSVEDKRALKIIEDTTRLVDGHYEVGLLWKDDEPRLPNNRDMADQRSESLRRRLTKSGNEEMAAKYREVMDGYINKGFARKLSEEELTSESDTCWYLPHHPVTNPTKPGKMRIVFDVAAEYNGTSLNKNLIHGPDMTNNLVAVLQRFRQGKIGIAADVEGMFHQIRVRKEDQDSLRFLWWTNSYDEPPDVYVMQVHVFGAASSPCVANSSLQRVADDNADAFGPSVVAAVKKNSMWTTRSPLRMTNSQRFAWPMTWPISLLKVASTWRSLLLIPRKYLLRSRMTSGPSRNLTLTWTNYPLKERLAYAGSLKMMT